MRYSVPAEPTRWVGCLDLGEVKIADHLQCVGGGAILQAGRHSFQPGGILALQRGQLGNGGPPTLSAAAVIDWSARPDDRHAGGTSGAAASLALGIGHRAFPDRFAWHGQLRTVTSRNPGRTGRSGAVLEPPALVAGFDTVAGVGQRDRVSWSCGGCLSA
ncbi:MAG: hypothetical protein P4L40_27055 [Terracidiphilus sp.]|nr:hypothetical protein [Terracidiphilus sp.]